MHRERIVLRKVLNYSFIHSVSQLWKGQKGIMGRAGDKKVSKFKYGPAIY